MVRTFHAIAVLFLATAATTVCFAAPKPARSRQRADSEAVQAVDGVLAAERDGSVANRSRRLHTTVRQSPDFAPAQWQSGRVNLDGQWVSIHKSFTRLSGDKTLAEYRALRAKTPKTLTGQLQLATWCRQHKLYDQQRAHLTAVLEINPNHAAARKALGFVRMGPFWISMSELKRRQKDAEQAAKDLKRWAPTVKSIRDAMASGNRLRFQQGLKRLKAIDDPAAIPVIELLLTYGKPQLALIAIDYLGEKKSKESTLALCRQGLFSPWKTMRKRAAERLKKRKLEDFVPQILDIIATPLESRRVIYFSGAGELLLRDLYHRETRTTRYIDILDQRRVDRSVSVIQAQPSFADFPSTARFTLPQSYLEPFQPGLARHNNDSLQRVKDAVHDRENAAEQINWSTSEINQRAIAMLSAVSGKNFQNDPKKCWRWWKKFTEVKSDGEKRTYVRRLQIETINFIPEYTIAGCDYTPKSCLVAGTPVWTDRGPVAVDKVQIGDRVLSQNVETGELAYKPVLKTTVRPKRPLIAVEIGPRTVRMTGGHPFWISGKGWVKARDIKAGMAMHDVIGTTAVRPVGTAAPEPTYNLIVADFHTYFVGETKVLSHDNTPIEPTNALVPGLLPKR
jgi:Pretoxin HINT domain